MAEYVKVLVTALTQSGKKQGGDLEGYVGRVCYSYTNKGGKWISLLPPSTNTGYWPGWFVYEPAPDESNYLAKLEEL